ncbi:MAG: leucine--tRNA ligase [Planctomycetes bacterium]|nr:leucine--tRNA ligase [Planctomycetota bacterium]
MRPYDVHEIEGKWVERWASAGTFRAREGPDAEKFYALTMFPYPIGETFRLEQLLGFVVADAAARFARLEGKRVLQSVGWDAFGMPVELASLKAKEHPEDFVARCRERLRAQLRRLGLAIDWDREVTTSDPSYYRWTQWLFVRLFDHGLAYRRTATVRWCPRCSCALAAEEEEKGRCSRCSGPVESRESRQWVLRLTNYVEELLADLDDLEWPEPLKRVQRNWIGRDEGLDIAFRIAHPFLEEFSEVRAFVTRPELLFGATFLLIHPDHPSLENLPDEYFREEIEAYRKMHRDRRAAGRFEIPPGEAVRTGLFAINPLTFARIPVLASCHVPEGEESAPGVPAHSRRDFDIARTLRLPILDVVWKDRNRPTREIAEPYLGDGVLVHSGSYAGLSTKAAREGVTEELIRRGIGVRRVRYRLEDWSFSRHRYWGEPIPIIRCPECGDVPVPDADLPVRLPRIEKIEPASGDRSPLEGLAEFVRAACPRCGKEGRRETDTMPQWAGSCWYYLRFASPGASDRPFRVEDARAWLPVDLYVGGVEHLLLHLLYSRFFTKFLLETGEVEFSEPFRHFLGRGRVLARTSEERHVIHGARDPVPAHELLDRYGADGLRGYLLFSGPPEGDVVFDEGVARGMSRFIRRLWRVFRVRAETGKFVSKRVLVAKHRLIRRVGERLKAHRYHTAISAAMEFVRFLQDSEITEQEVDRQTLRVVAIVLAPLFPFLAEELWAELGGEGSVFDQRWPQVSEELLTPPEVEIGVQVNGRLCDRFTCPSGQKREDLGRLALLRPKVRAKVGDARLKWIFFVPDHLVNLVTVPRGEAKESDGKPVVTAPAPN